MLLPRITRPRVVTLPSGDVLSVADLPVSSKVRWWTHRKILVGQAVVHGLIDPEEACRRYDLSHAELGSWIKAAQANDPKRLRVTVR